MMKSKIELSMLSGKSPTITMELSSLWAKMYTEEKLQWFFIACDDKWSARLWAEQVCRDNVQVIVIRNQVDTLGFVLLDGVRPRRAILHFCWFRPIGVKIVRASRWVCDELLRYYDLDVLVGLIPEVNRQATRLAELVGFEWTGFLPLGSYVHRLRRSVFTQVYCYPKQFLAEKEGAKK